MNGLRGVIAGGLGVGWLALFVFFFYLAGWEVAQDEVWFPFEVDLSAAEGSFWGTELDAPAGKYGFVRAGPDGNFVFDDGRPVRFWGVGLGRGLTAPPPELADQLAQRLAGLGINLVRFAYLDDVLFQTGPEGSLRLNPDQIERFDYFTAQLKQRGIYVDLVLNGFRRFSLKDGVKDADNPNFQSTYEGQRLLRSMAFVDPFLLKWQQDAARLFFDHRNPYTQNVYAEEPAVAMIEIINETSLTYGWLRGFLKLGTEGLHVSPYYAQLLDVRWNLWLWQRYGSQEALRQAWRPEETGRIGLLEGEDLSRRSVRRIAYAERERFASQRVQDQLRFYFELERDYYRGFQNFLKQELGVQVPISGTHTFHGLANQAAQADMDFAGGHVQWQHPIFLRGQPWNEPPIRIINTPMVKGQAAQIPYKADWIETRNTLARAAFGMAQAGKPFVISEYNHAFPNEYLAEFPLIVAAGLSLQDWDGLVVHEYAFRPEDLRQTQIHDVFMIHNNPVLLVQFPFASRLLRQGFVRPARKHLELTYDEDQALRLTLACGIDPYCSLEGQGVVPEMVLSAQVANRFVREKNAKRTTLPAEESISVSEGGDLSWNREKGIVQIDTDYAQAAVGFLGGETIVLRNLIIEAYTDFAAIGAISLDGQPLTTAKKILLTAVSRVKNQDMQIQRDPVGFFLLTDWGTSPVLVQDVRARIQLRATSPTWRVFALDERARPVREVNTTHRGNRLTFEIGGQTTLWYGLCLSEGEKTCTLDRSTAP